MVSNKRIPSALLAFVVLAVSGCESSSNIENTASESDAFSGENETYAVPDAAVEKGMATSSEGTLPSDAGQLDDMDFVPLSLNVVSGSANAKLNAASAAEETEANVKAVIQKLQPLQVILGQWRGTTRREYEGFKAVDNHEWVWDLQTNPDQPALVVKSDKSPYIRNGRITWDIMLDQFILTADDSAGVSRRFLGTFTEPVHEIVGSDDKMHRVFRLEFNQDEDTRVAGETPVEFWQIAFAQQENNRYLLEIGQRRAKTEFRRFDTVSTQREGTSFALSDSDYGEKTCIISEGLGTTLITYKGRDYWVCCSGCKAAFEEDPEKWIARASTRDNSK